MWRLTLGTIRAPLQCRRLCRPRTDKELREALAIMKPKKIPILVGMYFGLHGDPHHLLAEHDGPWKPTVEYDEKEPYPLPAVVFGDPEEARRNGPSKKDYENFESIMAQEEYLANCTIATMDGTAIFIDFHLLTTKEQPFPIPLWEFMYLRPRIFKAVFSPPRLEKAIQRSVGRFMDSMSGQVEEEMSMVCATAYRSGQRLHQIFGFIDTRVMLMKSKDFLESRPCLDIDQAFQLIHLVAVFLGPNNAVLMEKYFDSPPARPEGNTAASKAQAFARVWGLDRESTKPDDMEMEAYNAILMRHLMVNAQACVDVLIGYLLMHMADYLQVPVEDGSWLKTLFSPQGEKKLSLAWETLQRECIDHLAWLPDIETPAQLRWEGYLADVEEWYQEVKFFNLQLEHQEISRTTLLPPTFTKENRDAVETFYQHFTPPLFEGRAVADYPMGIIYQPDVAHGSGEHTPPVTMRMEIVKRGPMEFRRQLRHFSAGRLVYLKQRYRNPHVTLPTIRMYVYNGGRAKDNDVEYHSVKYKRAEARIKNRYRPITEPFHTPAPEGAYIPKDFPALTKPEPVARTGRSTERKKTSAGQGSSSTARSAARSTHRATSRRDTADHRNRHSSRERSDSRRRRKGDHSDEKKRAHERSADRRKKDERKTARSSEKTKQEKRRREPTTSPMDVGEEEMQILDQTEGDMEEEERYSTPVGTVERPPETAEQDSAQQSGQPGPSASGSIPPEAENRSEETTPKDSDKQTESASADGLKGRSVSAPPIQQLPPTEETRSQKKKKRKQEEERIIPVVVEEEEKEKEDQPGELVIDLRDSPQSPTITGSQEQESPEKDREGTEEESPDTEATVKRLVVETPVTTRKEKKKETQQQENQENEARMATPPPAVQQGQAARQPLQPHQLPQQVQVGANQDMIPVPPIPVTRAEPTHRPIATAKPPTAQIPPLAIPSQEELRFANRPSVYTRLETSHRSYPEGLEDRRPRNREDSRGTEQRFEAEQTSAGPVHQDRAQPSGRLVLADLPPVPNYQGDFPTVPPPWESFIRQLPDATWEWGPMRDFPYQADMIQPPPAIMFRRPVPAAQYYEHINNAPPEALLTPADQLLAIVLDNGIPARNPEHSRGWPTRWLHMINELVMRIYHTIVAKKKTACEPGSNRIRLEFLRELCQNYQYFLQRAAERSQYSFMEWEVLLRVIGKRIRAMLVTLMHQKVTSGLLTPRQVQDSVTQQEIRIFKWKPKTAKSRENQQKRFDRRAEHFDQQGQREPSESGQSSVSRTPTSIKGRYPTQQEEEQYELWLLQGGDGSSSSAFPSPQDAQIQPPPPPGLGTSMLPMQPAQQQPQSSLPQDLTQLQYQQASAQQYYPQTQPMYQPVQPQAQQPQMAQLPQQPQQPYAAFHPQYQPQYPFQQPTPPQPQSQWQIAPQQIPVNIQNQQQVDWNVPQPQQYAQTPVQQQTFQPQFGPSSEEQQAMIQSALTQPAQHRPATAPHQPTFVALTGSAPVQPTADQGQQNVQKSQKEKKPEPVPVRQVSSEVATQYDRAATETDKPSASTRQPFDPATTDMDQCVEQLSNLVTRGIRKGYNSKQLMAFILGKDPNLFAPEILMEYLREYVLFGTGELPEWFNVQDPHLPLTTNERIGVNRAIRRIMGQRQGDDGEKEKGKGKAGPSGGQGK